MAACGLQCHLLSLPAAAVQWLDELVSTCWSRVRPTPPDRLGSMLGFAQPVEQKLSRPTGFLYTTIHTKPRDMRLRQLNGTQNPFAMVLLVFLVQIHCKHYHLPNVF